eukprot:654788-Pleurochrysis_carterae.AAC.2
MRGAHSDGASTSGRPYRTRHHAARKKRSCGIDSQAYSQHTRLCSQHAKPCEALQRRWVERYSHERGLMGADSIARSAFTVKTHYSASEMLKQRKTGGTRV